MNGNEGFRLPRDKLGDKMKSLDQTQVAMNRLVAFASKDETRESLVNPYRDADGWVIATDGYRMYGTKLLPGTTTGCLLKSALKSGDIVQAPGTEGCQFLDWRNVMPKNIAATATLEIPEWVSRLRPADEAPGAFCANGTLALGRADDASVTVNLALLAPFAGETVLIGFGSNAFMPVIIVAPGANPAAPLATESQWFAVVGPFNPKTLTPYFTEYQIIGAQTDSLKRDDIKLSAKEAK